MGGLSQSQKNIILNILSERLHVFSIILFGSAAKEALREDSDIDLAFINDAASSPYEIFMIAQELADLLKREVDLMNFRQASTVLQAQIVAKGVILLDKEPIVRQYAFMQALKAYALLNEERSAIISMKDLAEGGSDDWLKTSF